MAQAQKRCPICDTQNPKKAAYCMNCGASLTHAEVDVRVSTSRPANGGYDFRYGETDLSEDGLRGKARLYLASIIGVLVVVASGLLMVWVAPRFSPVPTETPTPSPTSNVTPSPVPTLALATVTQGPPTLTPTYTPTSTFTPAPTNTPEPCVQTVGAGEGMLALISRCGHRDLDVIALVVTLNGLNDENDLRAGQSVIIPYPTPTIDPNAVPATAESSAGSNPETQTVSLGGGSGGLSQADIQATQAVDPFFAPTPTNPPGIGSYTIVFNDSIIEIISRYNTTLDTLDKLNPEMEFYQCEMGQTFGGPACVVPIYEGQVIRVPVPTATPTFTFTPNGSETPLPTATPTYNAPNPLSPDNRAYFRTDEIITLRWAATGTLADGEVYLVTAQNLGEGLAFTGETRELFWVIPQTWQGEQAGQIEYIWTVAIAPQGKPEAARYTSPSRSFTWEGRGEKS